MMLRFYHRTAADTGLLKQYREGPERPNANPRRCRQLATATLGRIEHPCWHLEWGGQPVGLAYEHQCPATIHVSGNAQVYAM
jgi:hypothetical protein